MSNVIDLLGLNSKQQKNLDKFIRQNSSINLEVNKLKLNEENQTIIRYFYLMKKFKLDKSPFVNSIDMSSINSSIEMLKRNNSSSLNEIYNLKPKKDAGPGEFLLYFLINSSSIEGTGDLKLSGQTYEVKSAKISTNFGGKHAYDFETGTYKAVDTIYQLNLLAESFFNRKIPYHSLPKSAIDQLKNTEQYESIKNNYAKNVVDNYFKSDKIIIFNRKTKLISAIKKIKPEDVSIERITRGSIKPLIKI